MEKSGYTLTDIDLVKSKIEGRQFCNMVKSYKKEYLSSELMENEENFGRQSLADKFFSTQEGSTGGNVGLSGRCGCAK